MSDMIIDHDNVIELNVNDLSYNKGNKTIEKIDRSNACFSDGSRDVVVMY